MHSIVDAVKLYPDSPATDQHLVRVSNGDSLLPATPARGAGEKESFQVLLSADRDALTMLGKRLSVVLCPDWLSFKQVPDRNNFQT